MEMHFGSFHAVGCVICDALPGKTKGCGRTKNESETDTHQTFPTSEGNYKIWATRHFHVGVERSAAVRAGRVGGGGGSWQAPTVRSERKLPPWPL